MGLGKVEPEPRLIFQGRDLKNFILVNDVMYLYICGHYIPVREVAYALSLKVDYNNITKIAYVD